MWAPYRGVSCASPVLARNVVEMYSNLKKDKQQLAGKPSKKGYSDDKYIGLLLLGGERFLSVAGGDGMCVLLFWGKIEMS